MSPETPRAVGRRIDHARLPEAVRSWIETTVGSPVVEAAGQIGGMSPGVAARLRTEDGQRVFIKAVGTRLNPQTPDLFRLERRVLSRLPRVPYRTTLRAAFDAAVPGEGKWVALLLDDVDGRHPDLNDPADLAAVREVVDAQTAELTPAPAGLELTPVSETVRRWLERWETVASAPARYLPDWAVPHVGAWLERIATLPDRLGGDTLCHFDLRDDNLLVRPDGGVVVLDWGMARRGPAWVDVALVEIERDDPEASVAGLADRGVGLTDVTDLLLAFAGSQAWNARQPAKPGLPTFPAHAAADAVRFLDRARRLLRAGA